MAETLPRNALERLVRAGLQPAKGADFLASRLGVLDSSHTGKR